ncbi:MAG: hypothetical protein ABH845_04060 [Candidatus Omnitrophota bacterium]
MTQARWMKKAKTPVILAWILLFLFGTAWGIYTSFGHGLIKAMYEERAVGILNRVIEDQHLHPLEHYYEKADHLFFTVILSLLFLLAFILMMRNLRGFLTWPEGKKWLEHHTDGIDAIPDTQVHLWIALASGLGLYIELMMIRFHASSFQLFAYFKNISLLSCFLGLGIGYARGPKRPVMTPLVLPFLALQLVCLHILRYSPVERFLQYPISEQLAMGVRQAEAFGYIFIAYIFLVLTFTFNALCFIPLGHLASRLMMRQKNLVAYSWNLIGSLIGILLFSLISFLWSPPAIWIVCAAIGIMLFLRKDVKSLFPSVLALVITLGIFAMPFSTDQFDFYSPYQKLTLKFSKDEPPVLKANNSNYMQILDLRNESVRISPHLKSDADYYGLPYRFKPNPEEVLIVGSGTGNDVAAAIRNGAGRIDAVEIDPAIVHFGKQLHPESPYQAPNVRVIVNDARAFIRRTSKQYDLIVYGLLDSHGLLSSRSGGVRLDSYVYTVEAFREARKKLKPDGMMCLSFALIRPSLGRKLFLMLQEAFNGRSPLVFGESRGKDFTFLAGDALDRRVLTPHPVIQETTEIFADPDIRADKSTDDWPFFYMPRKKYPLSYVVMMVLLFMISVTFIRRLMPGSGSGFSIPCFFLGAGFMLIETKGITELALVFGSTWIVISVVIVGVLVMAFWANWILMKRASPSPPVTYGLLFLSLMLGLGFTFIHLSHFPLWLGRIIMTAVLTLPLFFSGFAFSSELKKAVSVAAALSSNLLGAMLGGFLEYNSMYFGFRSLYFLALFMYTIAFLGSVRVKR